MKRTDELRQEVTVRQFIRRIPKLQRPTPPSQREPTNRTTGDNVTRVIGGSLSATDKAVVVLLESSSVTTLLVR